MVPPSGKVWVTSKLQVTRSPCTLPLDLAVVSVWVGSPGRVDWEGMSKACRTKTAWLATTWPGVKSPLPLTVNWTVCPSQAAGKVRLFLAPLGSAAAPWARAASIRIPKVSATQRRRSMQLPSTMRSDVELGTELGRFPSLLGADSEVQRPKATTPRRARWPCRNLSVCWQAGNRSIAVIALLCLFEACLFRANQRTPTGGGSAGGMIGDRVVVSELRRVWRPAGGQADLRVGCPRLPVVVRPIRMLRGPSAAPRSRVRVASRGERRPGRTAAPRRQRRRRLARR